ncbi:hypothetical protein D3C77_584780 [compost metagenome]
MPRDEVERLVKLLQYQAHPYPSPHAEFWQGLLDDPAAQRQGEPVLIQAVAVTREDEDEGLRLVWLLEGGISEMEFPGMVLFALPDANGLCEANGSAEVYLHPPAADGFTAEQMTAQGADGYRTGIKAAAELAEAYPELAQAIRALPLPQ